MEHHTKYLDCEVGRSGIDTSGHDEPSGVVIIDIDASSGVDIVNQE